MTRLVIQTCAETVRNIRAGQFRFINRLNHVLTQQGWHVSSRARRRGDRWLDRWDGAYHLHEISGAIGARGLNFRRAYFFPWWMFDYPNQRYGGRIGGMPYDEKQIDGRAASAFYADLQKHYLVGWARGNPDGYALVPLQAHLTRQRAWQFTDLAGMVAQIRQHDPARKIILKPHPKLVYSAAENALLSALCQCPLVQLREEPMDQIMGGAAYIATHNSAAAFEAMVLGIPSILFADTDFHHICPQVRAPGDAGAAFARLRGAKPDFGRYLYWFLNGNCVHAGQDDAFARIADLLALCGWPVIPHSGPTT